MNADGSGQTNLTKNGASDSNPAFTPDGKIVFVTNRDGNYEIYEMDADGSNQTNLTNNGGYDADPAVSPDGKISFTSGRDGNFEVYSMDADGSNQTNLTNNPAGWDSFPNFSPDGKEIVFQSGGNSGSTFDIYVMNADGTGTPTRLTTDPAIDQRVAFSPDGKQIIFSTNRDGGYEIYAMNADGTGTPTRLTNDPASDEVPDWGVAPDTTPPDTKIDSGPTGPTNDDTPTFTFSGSDDTTASNDLLFSYKVDDGNWSSYSADTSVTLGSLTDGDHTFYVRAKDKAGNEDQSPAQQSFTVDTKASDATIDSGPLGTVNSSSASFDFSSNESGATFECKLDNGDFASCASPKEYTGLNDGDHTFQVRATDRAGNTGTAASRTWTVDTTAPTVSSVTPADKATGVALDTDVTATFSEAMSPSTLTTSTFTLVKQGTSTPIGATVTYDAATNKATFTPNVALEAGATYTATVKGDSSGAKDAAGNPLAGDKVWSFTTVAAPPSSGPPPSGPPSSAGPPSSGGPGHHHHHRHHHKKE